MRFPGAGFSLGNPLDLLSAKPTSAPRLRDPKKERFVDRQFESWPELVDPIGTLGPIGFWLSMWRSVGSGRTKSLGDFFFVCFGILWGNYRKKQAMFVFSGEQFWIRCLQFVPTHMLHLWNIYLYIYHTFRCNVGKYTSHIRRIWAISLHFFLFENSNLQPFFDDLSSSHTHTQPIADRGLLPEMILKGGSSWRIWIRWRPLRCADRNLGVLSIQIAPNG